MGPEDYPIPAIELVSNSGLSADSVHQWMPKATRTTGIIQLSSSRTVFYNEQICPEDAHNPRKWHIQRILCYGISCREYDERMFEKKRRQQKEKKLKRILVKFYGIKNASRTVFLKVPSSWVPKTFLVLLYDSMLKNSVISIFSLNGEFDVNKVVEENIKKNNFNYNSLSIAPFVDGGTHSVF